MENGKGIRRNPETLMAGEGDSIHLVNEKPAFQAEHFGLK